MAKVTIYVPDDQFSTYEKAKERLGESISATFLRCLEGELEAQRANVERIVVELEDYQTGALSKKAFEGSWLIGGAEKGEAFDFHASEDCGLTGPDSYSVACTKRRRLAILEFNGNGRPCMLRVFDNFEKVKAASPDNSGYPRYPRSLLRAIASALDVELIEELDI